MVSNSHIVPDLTLQALHSKIILLHQKLFIPLISYKFTLWNSLQPISLVSSGYIISLSKK